MRKLALPLALLALAALVTLPQTSAAADFPALLDGGSIINPGDGGFLLCATSANTRHSRNGWNAVVRCDPYGVYYQACTDATCVPTVHSQYLAPAVTYDIGMPGGLDNFCIKTFDGGSPYCTLNYRRDRGE